MNASGKQRDKDVDGHADTHVASSAVASAASASSGGAFARTELSGPGLSTCSAAGGTFTDLSSNGSPRRKHQPADGVARSDRYDVEGEFARGGLGRVLKARDDHLGRTVAIKELLNNSNFAESLFIREALVTARLQHPGIVPVHEAGRWPSGDPYYVMKLLSGETLQKRIRGMGGARERLSLLPNVLDVVETIAYAHSQGIIHRDIKPANVVVGEFGETVVVDWGLARDDREPVPPVPAQASAAADAALDDDPGEESGEGASGSSASDPSRSPTASGKGKATARGKHGNKAGARASSRAGNRASNRANGPWLVSGNYSVSGKVVGTPAYMSPEQARGGEVDERTDVYALGALMYQVLCGKAPYPGKNLQEVLEHVLAGPPTPLAERLAKSGGQVSPELITIVERAMARERDDRYPSAKELAEDLRRFQTGQLVSVHQYTTFTLVKRWVRRHRAPLAVAAAAMLILSILAVVSVDRIVEERNVARVQHKRAQRAQAKAQKMKNKLIFEHAESSLWTDPTTAIAWLQEAPLEGKNLARVRTLAEQAAALGVARHVVEGADQPNGVAFINDGKQVLVADMGGTLFTIDVATGAKHILARHKTRFGHLGITRDGSRVAVAAVGHIMVFAMTDLKKPLLRIPCEGVMNYLWFSSDGKQLIGLFRGVTATVWDAATGSVIRAGHRVDDKHASVNFARTPELIDGGKTVIVRDRSGVESTGEGTAIARLSPPVPIVRAVMTKAGDRVIAAGEDRRWYVMGVTDGSIVKRGEMSGGHFSALEWMGMRPDLSDRWLIVETNPREPIVLYDLASERAVRLYGHEEEVYQILVAPDNSFAVTASDDTTVRVWDLDSGAVRVLRGHTDDVFRATVSPDSEWIASASRDRTVRIWSVHGGEPELIAVPREPRKPFRVIAFDGPGHVIGTTSDGRSWRYDLSGGSSWQDLGKPGGEIEFIGKWGSSDGSLYLIGKDSDKRVIWSIKERSLRELEGAGEHLHARNWAPDSSGYAEMESDGRVGVWSTNGDRRVELAAGERRCSVALAPGSDRVALITSERVEEYGVPGAPVGSSGKLQSHDISGDSLPCHLMEVGIRARYSPDGKLLAVAYPHRGLMVIDTATGAKRAFDVSRHNAGLLMFSPNSRNVASWHEDLSVYLIDLQNGTSRRVGYHEDLTLDMAFAPDSDFLITASFDRTVRIWDVAGEDHRVLRNHSGPVRGIAISPDGKRVVSTSMDRTVRIWDTSARFAPDASALRAFLDAQTSADIDGSSLARTRRVPGTGTYAYGEKDQR